MKKRIALLLAGVMVIGMLQGCGGKSETPSSTQRQPPQRMGGFWRGSGAGGNEDCVGNESV